MKCSVWLVDPRVNHPRVVELVEKSFELGSKQYTGNDGISHPRLP